ncbi:hypothetical protein L211DRAFT_895545 [Terfezia boudieri ATCC MYA-4762]|uniref:Uncharacterized protein n=1 Tax=Terfezia boudieri ATCC MYA-4762 TaxID=1051890 RepID=A0A3N4LAT4_9PEZI|nr:hypothetical protein L211DRAFT_895545 [Terfezia boudieri ATCC MYA-4762]
MPGKGKRKDNPGKLDRVNPPLKTRLPVTGHPQPTTSYTTTATATIPRRVLKRIDEMVVIFVNAWEGFIMIKNRLRDDIGHDAEVWEFALTGIFTSMAKAFENSRDFGTFCPSIQESAVRYEKKHLIPTILRKYPQAPPTPALTTTRTTGTQMTPPITPTRYSVSTNTDRPSDTPQFAHMRRQRPQPSRHPPSNLG